MSGLTGAGFCQCPSELGFCQSVAVWFECELVVRAQYMIRPLPETEQK